MRHPALIAGWQHCLRLKSIRVAVLLAIASLAQAELLPLLKLDFPSRVWPYVSFAFAAWITYARLVAQPGVLEGKAPPADPDPKP